MGEDCNMTRAPFVFLPWNSPYCLLRVNKAIYLLYVPIRQLIDVYDRTQWMIYFGKKTPLRCLLNSLKNRNVYDTSMRSGRFRPLPTASKLYFGYSEERRSQSSLSRCLEVVSKACSCETAYCLVGFIIAWKIELYFLFYYFNNPGFSIAWKYKT